MLTRFRTVYEYRALIGNFQARELKTLYRRSLLGWLWSLLNPLSQIVIYSLVFSKFLKFEPDVSINGDLRNFTVFLFSGLVTWNAFANMLNGALGWFAGAGGLLKKVYFPAETAIFGGAVSAAVQVLIEGLVLMVVLGFLGHVSITFILLPYILFCAMLFGLGMGMFLAIANTYYRDVSYLIGIVLNAWFFLTPIVYGLRVIPEDLGGVPARDLVELNPMTQIISAVRDVTYDLVWPSATRMIVMTVLSVTSLLVGWSYFTKRAHAAAEEL